MGVPQNGWFIRKKNLKIDDFGVSLFMETRNFYDGCFRLSCACQVMTPESRNFLREKSSSNPIDLACRRRARVMIKFCGCWFIHLMKSHEEKHLDNPNDDPPTGWWFGASILFSH